MREKLNSALMRFNMLLVGIAFVITLALVMSGAYAREGYDIKVGSVSQQRIKAPRRVENIIATQHNRELAEEAADKMDPVTERDSHANERMVGYLNEFFSIAEDYRRDAIRRQSEILPTPVPTPATTPAPTEVEQEEESRNQGQGESLGVISVPIPAPSPKVMLPINLNEAQLALLSEMSDEEFQDFKEQVLEAQHDILEGGIQKIDERSLFGVKERLDKLDMVGDEKTLANDIIVKYLEPNVVVNEEATSKARTERAARYETIYYLQDQMIVDDGLVVTEEAYAALESLGLVRSSYTDNLWMVAGVVIMVFAIFALTVAYVYNFCKSTISNKKEVLLLFTLYVLVIFVTWLFINAPFLFVPILVFTMLVAQMFDTRMSIVLNISVTLICLMIFKGDVEFLIFYLLTGIFVSLISKYATERNKVILVGFFTCVVNVLIYLGVSLFFEKRYSDAMLTGAIYAFVSGISVVVISIGSTPFWEAVYGVVTTFKLQDLTNPNNHLLRRLTIEAPGTYHHSLIVANLAETAAYEIGANPNLARAGGYYHDVGKLKYPQYFSENQVSGNAHDTMDPYSSVQIIISHVSFGLDLAKQNHLPPVIRDIIAQHHGNGLIKYFYHKAQKAGEELEEEDFRYNYPIPQSREAAIVMMADTVEAAVRSMIPSGKSIDEVEKFVRELIRDKLDEGQLNDSELTIKDIDAVTMAFMRVFKGMYHERISYPTVERPGSKKKEAEE